MSDPATVLDPGRAAHASILGYLYQAYLGVERWLELKEDEVLRCEGDEDLDRLLRDGSGGWSEQVKALTGSINIRDEVVKETLRRFAVSHHRLRTADPPDLRRFLFTSTATRRTQRLDDRLPVDVLAVWEEAREPGAVQTQVVEVLRTILPLTEPEEQQASRLFREQLQQALAWLAADTERWADLVRSVEWRLGEPQLSEVRGRIDQALTLLRHDVPPSLQHRLLGEVLEASIASEPRDRCRTREQLVKLLDQADVEVARWLATSRGQRLVQRVEELDNLRGILFDKPLDLPPSPRPGQLLTAAYEVIPFDETGRVEILDDLARWCADGRLGLVRLIYGDGGLGKTRLLIEWCRRLAAQGWLAGFLEPMFTDHELPRLLEGRLPRLVVIDYAETRLDAVRTLVSRLSHQKDGPKIRLVLLARREGDWWQTLRMDAATEDLLESTHPHELPRLLPGLEERRNAFRTAAHAFAQHLLPSQTALRSPLPEPDLTEEAFGRPLYLHMAALAAAQGHPVTRAEEALAKTLERERRYWREEIQDQDLDDEIRFELGEVLPIAVTALTLLGGLETERRTRELAQCLLLGAGVARAKLLARLMHRLYSALAGSGRHIGGLEPDLLGEELVWDELRHDLHPLHIALDLADPAGQRQILTVLTRLIQQPERASVAEAWLREAFEAKLDDLAEPGLEVAVALGDPVGQLLSRIIQQQASLELATRVMDRCDGSDLQLSVPLREVALHSTQRVYDQLQERRDQNAAKADTEEARGELARVALHLGNRLSNLGRREEALQATQEAVEIRRLLVQQQPDVFRPGLALSLNNLGNLLSDLGRREEALQAIQEAVEIYRLLAPDAFRPDLARSLNNLGKVLSALGRHEEALQATQKAVEIYRLLAQQRPDAFKLYLALSLNNLGNMLSALGRREEALQATQEAVEIRRLLAQQRPDAFRPNLAHSLNNLGIMLSALGRREEALQATQEAVEIYRLLAQQRPDAFRPYLAMSLGNLSMRFSDTGRSEEALAAAEEGVRLLAPFFLRYPRTFEGWMTNNARSYRLCSQEENREPNLELLGPIEAALAALKEELGTEP